MYFNQLSGAARTRKLVETLDFSREITEKALKWTKRSPESWSKYTTSALKYSWSCFFLRGAISNSGTLFYTTLRFKKFYRVGPRSRDIATSSKQNVFRYEKSTTETMLKSMVATNPLQSNFGMYFKSFPFNIFEYNKLTNSVYNFFLIHFIVKKFTFKKSAFVCHCL